MFGPAFRRNLVIHAVKRKIIAVKRPVGRIVKLRLHDSKEDIQATKTKEPEAYAKNVKDLQKIVAVTATLFLISVNHLDDVHLVFFRSANRD